MIKRFEVYRRACSGFRLTDVGVGRPRGVARIIGPKNPHSRAPRMPELPEVETTRRGLLPHLVGRTIRDVVVRNANLRWPVPRDLGRHLRGERVLHIRRLAKYLLLHCR